jgi:hypothetical protein
MSAKPEILGIQRIWKKSDVFESLQEERVLLDERRERTSSKECRINSVTEYCTNGCFRLNI